MNTIVLSVLTVIIVWVVLLYYFYDTPPTSIITLRDKNKNRKSRITDFRFDKLISKKQAANVVVQIKKDRKYWNLVNPVMYLFGTASYVHGHNFEDYKRKYKKSNRIFKKGYSDSSKTILDYFQSRVEKHVKVKYRFAFPGFHIFKCNKLFSLPVASKHIDLQYKRLKFKESENIDFENTLSFTLCLKLPKSGGGLYVYEPHKTFVKYKEGCIVCLNGKTPHMIAPSPLVSNNKKTSESPYKVMECLTKQKRYGGCIGNSAVKVLIKMQIICET